MLAIGLLPACRCHPALAGRLPVPTRSLTYPVHPNLSYPRSHLLISPYLTAHPKFVALLCLGGLPSIIREWSVWLLFVGH
ncbi:hypothetical protein EV714DRAFT_245733, partial [Schizophyllum commune]